MIDSASISLWLTDVVLLALAYWIGRIHSSAILREVYNANLNRLLDEVRLMQKKVDRMGDIYLAATHTAATKEGKFTFTDPQDNST